MPDYNRKACQHGVLLYGNRCLNCEREKGVLDQVRAPVQVGAAAVDDATECVTALPPLEKALKLWEQAGCDLQRLAAFVAYYNQYAAPLVLSEVDMRAFCHQVPLSAAQVRALFGWALPDA